MKRVGVLDFGMGNLRSVAKAIEKAGASVEVTTVVPEAADALVVPGQGAFGSCMTNLGPRAEKIKQWIAGGRSYLGLCLGLQVLFESSEEGGPAGLGIFPGTVRRLPDGVKIPHIGWNEVTPTNGAPIFRNIEPKTRFYFVHSYYPDPTDASLTAATTDYAIDFCCAAWRDNIVATQFHPEKSGEAGYQLLRNFLEYCV